MSETDLLWMTALIFLPCVAALAILFVPRGSEEVMRWLATLGTAATLGISIAVLIGYLDLPGVTTPGGLSSLESRLDTAAADQGVRTEGATGRGLGARPPASDDRVGRIPWIRQF